MIDVDTEKFRLKRFVEKLDAMGEVTTIKEPIELTNLAAEIEANEKAVLFKSVGPEKLELVANVNGSRRRLAAALDVEEDKVIEEFQRRLDTPQPIVDVSQRDAPVQKIVLKGMMLTLLNYLSISNINSTGAPIFRPVLIIALIQKPARQMLVAGA